MKRIFLIFSIIIGSFNLYGQNLTMSELVKARRMDFEELDNFLTNKDWSIIEISNETINRYGVLRWAYKLDEISGYAGSFLTYLFSIEEEFSYIFIQVTQREKYIEYLKAIQDYGCKKIKSKITPEAEIITVYRGATTTFRIVKATMDIDHHEAETEVWVFYLFSNDDYEYVYDD